MSESDSEATNTNQTLMNFSGEFAAQLAEFLRQVNAQPKTQNQPPPPPPSTQPESLGEVHVQSKLNGDNYSVWTTLMKRAIGAKGLSSHINGVTDPPAISDAGYPKWEQRDNCCFNWIINNIEANLINEVSQYATARDLWEGLAITYGSGTDPFQVSDLHRQAYNMKQGSMSLESLWNKFQDIWMSIDEKDPNPMDTPSTIEKYNKITQRHRLYQFLWALDERYDTIKREILNKDPLPTVRSAYGLVRRESANERVLKPSGDSRETGIGVGLAAIDRSRPPPPPKSSTNSDKSRLTCSHCGGKKHTVDTCFHLHGFPDWWEDIKKNRQNRTRSNGSRATAAAVVGDRATNTNKAVGSIGNSKSMVNAGQTDGEGGDEKKATASVAVARAWSEGNQAPPVTIIGDTTSAAGVESEKPTEIGVGEGMEAAEVRVNGGYYTPNFLKFEKTPHHSSKSHFKPHSTNPTRNYPINFDISKKNPSSFKQSQISPKISKNSKSNPNKSDDLLFQPTIPCQNSFKALAFTSSTTVEKKENQWIFDCGATDTISFDPKDFLHISEPTKTYVQTAGGDLARVEGAGTINISPTLRLSNCLFVPTFSHKLLSVSHVTKELNCKLLMQPRFCMLQDTKTGTIVGRGTERSGLYYVDEIAQQSMALLAHEPTTRKAWLLHRRLGHPSIGYLKLMFPKLASSLNSLDCETCHLAKSHRHSFKLNNTRVPTPFSLIHSDVWGPAPIHGGQGLRYFLLFIDDFSRMTWVYFLKNKSEVFDKFTQFYKMVQTQYKQCIQVLRSDNGGEYINANMKTFFVEKGLIHQTSCAYTPEQNGVAERKNRYILEITRALLIESKIPTSFWPEAIATSVYLMNRLPRESSILKLPSIRLSTMKPYKNQPISPLNPKSLVARYSSIFQSMTAPNSLLVPLNVYFLGMVLIRKGTGAMIR